jgi:5'-nucleotidase
MMGDGPRRLILVTNDDGILSPGLDVLARIAALFGDVAVVAPEREMSGVSHAITLTDPLRSRVVGPGRWSLSGTPADCVFVAVNHILDRRPDLLLSGINRGPNLGYDVLYSGTVGGAMEGTIQHIPSIAFSLVSAGDFPFEWASQHVETMVRRVLEQGIPPRVTLNVNIPDPSIAPWKGFRATRLGNRFYSSDVIAREDPRGGEYLWLGGTRVTMESAPDSDCGAVHAGWGAVTPLTDDLLARDALARMDWVNGPEPVETPDSEREKNP